jgi:hypothetical protein
MPRANTIAVLIRSAIRAEWAATARSDLQVSARTTAEYIKALVPSDSSSAGVMLVGTFPNMFEQGLGPQGVGSEGPFDLRTTLLQPTTRSIKQGKKGLYLHVPFERSAGFIASQGGPDAEYKFKTQKATISRNGKTEWGGKLPPGLAPKAKPHHATDLLAGTYRNEGVYSKASKPGAASSTGRAFRTISQAGKPWIHPGIKAANLATRVMRDLGTIIARAFSEAHQ